MDENTENKRSGKDHHLVELSEMLQMEYSDFINLDLEMSFSPQKADGVSSAEALTKKANG